MTRQRAEAIAFLTIRRRSLAALATAAFLFTALPGCGGNDDDAPPPPPASWRSAWAAAPQDYNEPIPLPGYPQPVAASLVDTTLRQLVRPAVDGTQLRVHFSNVTGTVAVPIAAASIGRSTGGSDVDAASVAELRFSGAASVSLAAGAEVWSDPVTMSVVANTDYAVSLYVQQSTPYTTVHRSALRTAYAVTGNATRAASLTGATTATRYQLLSGLDVINAAGPKVVAAFGDSITDGTASTLGAFKRYPDQLADRVRADASVAGKVSVVNLGIAGNRVLSDKLGPKAVGRFERDVLQQSGITHAIILVGINDIGFAVFSGAPFNLITPDEVVSADQIIAGYQRMLDAARAKGVKVLLGTVMPFKGASYYNDANETKRQALNSWVRSQAANVHAVVDFDAAMKGSADPLALNPAYDSGDHLHPNDAGYAAMAAAVSLSKLTD
ncbi:SGNH/GDSL hydrolase family protein [Sphaerotilaceae bacterium SBD11-9]